VSRTTGFQEGQGHEPGVKTATVSFKDAETRILFDLQTIDEEALTVTIGKLGYRVVKRI